MAPAGIAETVTSDLGRARPLPRRRSLARRGGRAAHRRIAARDGRGARRVARSSRAAFSAVGPRFASRRGSSISTSGEAIADAKVDGPLEDIFTLQDGIVAAFARELGVPGIAHAPRLGVRETSSLEAYRAYTEGWLKIETLDTRSVPGAIADFERAIARRPALRDRLRRARERGVRRLRDDADRRPSRTRRRSRRASTTRARDPSSTRAWPKRTRRWRSCSSSAGRFDEARTAAQHGRRARARQLAASVPARPRALGRRAAARRSSATLALYPHFAFAHVRDGDGARRARPPRARPKTSSGQGVVEQDRQIARGRSLSALGFHWLLGALESARAADIDVRDRRVRSGARAGRSHGGSTGRSTARSRSSRAARPCSRPDRRRRRSRRSEAAASLRRRLPARLGRRGARARARPAMRRRADQARRHARHAQERFERTGRAARRVVHRGVRGGGRRQLRPHAQPARSAARLRAGSHVGWTLPIEPFFRPLHGLPGFATHPRAAGRARRNSSNVGLKTPTQRFSGFFRRVSGLARRGRRIVRRPRSADMAAGTYRDTLKRPGLQPFLWTQFLGAFNDNLFKIVVIDARGRTAAGAATRRASCRSSARCSSCRSCCSPATPASSPTSTASARCSSSMQDRSRSSRWRSALAGVRVRPPRADLRRALPDRRCRRRSSAPRSTASCRDAARPRSLARQRPARDEHVRRDRARHGDRRRSCSSVWRDQPWLIGVVARRRSRSSARSRASAFRDVPARSARQRVSRSNPLGEIWPRPARAVAATACCG